MSLFPPTPHLLLARHRTKAKIFYFNFRKATILFPPCRSTRRHPVKKAPTEGASPPSIAEEREEGERGSGPGDPAPSPSPLRPRGPGPRVSLVPHNPQPPRYLSLLMEGCLALITADSQGNVGIQMVQLLGAPHHQAILPDLQRQSQRAFLGMQWNQPTLPFSATGR